MWEYPYEYWVCPMLLVGRAGFSVDGSHIFAQGMPAAITWWVVAVDKARAVRDVRYDFLSTQ